jgi:hypothetical protein
MKAWIILILASIMSIIASAETVNFDNEKRGSLPTGWEAGITDNKWSQLFFKSTPKWSIEADGTAPSKPNVLKQSGKGTFPWCVKKDAKLTDGFVEVKFKSISGNEDQAGGLVWRWKNSNNYYIARANALENNISLYYVEDGDRKTIKYTDAPVAVNQWHTLQAKFSGKHITVSLDGKIYIEQDDEHITGTGAVGVWTKADSETAFDDFSYGFLPT